MANKLPACCQKIIAFSKELTFSLVCSPSDPRTRSSSPCTSSKLQTCYSPRGGRRGRRAGAGTGPGCRARGCGSPPLRACRPPFLLLRYQNSLYQRVGNVLTRFQLDRHRFLQVSSHFDSFIEIYKIVTPLHPSKLNLNENSTNSARILTDFDRSCNTTDTVARDHRIFQPSQRRQLQRVRARGRSPCPTFLPATAWPGGDPPRKGVFRTRTTSEANAPLSSRFWNQVAIGARFIREIEPDRWVVSDETSKRFHKKSPEMLTKFSEFF